MNTPAFRTRLPGILAGAGSGLLAAATAIGVGELLAAAVRPQAAPVIAVGGAAVDRTPRPLKEFAIRQFGEQDKLVLLAGIFTVLALIAIAGGIVARRRPLTGAAGIALLGVVGAGAALSRPGAGPQDALPSVGGAIAAVVALLLLTRHLAGTRTDEPEPALATAGATLATAGTGPGGTSTLTGPTDPDDGPGSTRTGAHRPGGVRATAIPGLRDELVSRDRKRGVAVDRRGFLVTGTVVGAVAAIAGFGGRRLQASRFDAAESRAAVRLPRPASAAPALPAAAQLDVPGITPYVTPNRSFYRVDTALVVPQVPTEGWQLRVHGMVDRELTIDFDTLLARPLIERDITLTCVSNEVGGNLTGSARWLGAPLADLLREAGVQSGADQIVATSADGMTIGTPTAVVLDGRDAMLAVGMNGEPLPLEHGFPVRMLVPGLYGYVSGTKWLVDLELTTFDQVDPYWVQRGWVQKAPIRTSSRIDTPKPLSEAKAGRVAVAGVAWAQQRGISAVEVRVDDGDWQRARLATAPSTDLWVQWVYEWDATPGPHNLAVRATDRSGQTQEEGRMSPFPSGSTGWHSVVVTIT